MSTRATIATIMSNGKIGQIYCHNSGYLGRVGRILVNHYQDFAKTEKLISLGAISSLGKNIEPSELIQRFGTMATIEDEFKALPEKEQDRLLDENADHVLAYHRDKGEELRINIFDNIPQYLDMMKSSAEEFNYLLAYDKDDNPQWYLLLDEGFFALCDIPGLEMTPDAKYQVNIADFDSNNFISNIQDCRKTMIMSFLQIVGEKYHLGYKSSKKVKVSYSKMYGSYSVDYFDPVTNEPFHISIYDSGSSVTANFTYSVTKQILTEIKSELQKNHPDMDDQLNDPLLNSQIYSIFDKLYKSVMIENMEHKLDQVSVLAAK